MNIYVGSFSLTLQCTHTSMNLYHFLLFSGSWWKSKLVPKRTYIISRKQFLNPGKIYHLFVILIKKKKKEKEKLKVIQIFQLKIYEQAEKRWFFSGIFFPLKYEVSHSKINSITHTLWLSSTPVYCCAKKHTAGLSLTQVCFHCLRRFEGIFFLSQVGVKSTRIEKAFCTGGGC